MQTHRFSTAPLTSSSSTRRITLPHLVTGPHFGKSAEKHGKSAKLIPKLIPQCYPDATRVTICCVPRCRWDRHKKPPCPLMKGWCRETVSGLRAFQTWTQRSAALGPALKLETRATGVAPLHTDLSASALSCADSIWQIHRVHRDSVSLRRPRTRHCWLSRDYKRTDSLGVDRRRLPRAASLSHGVFYQYQKYWNLSWIRLIVGWDRGCEVAARRGQWRGLFVADG
jgi:hypothetical protein